MSWEERNISCQQKQGGGAGWEVRLSLPRLALRVVALLMVWAIMAVGAAEIGGGRVATAASPAQGSAPNAGTLAIVGASGARLYATPGGESIRELTPGTVLTAVGRSADNLWVVAHVVVQNNSDIAGWVEVNEVVLFGIEQLPVMVEGNVPVAAPTANASSGASSQEPVLLPTTTATPLPTATPTPSPLPTATPPPTATPLPTPSPTPMPTALPTSTPVASPAASPASPGNTASSAGGESSLVAVVRGGGAGLYDRPDGSEAQQLSTGTVVTAWGRSADGEWLVVIASSGAAGWVQTAQVVVFNIETLPVLDSATGLPPTTDAEGASTPSAAQPEPTAGGEDTTPQAPVSTDPNSIIASVTLTDSRLNIRSGPGTNFAIVAKAEPGDSYAVSGRNTAATWIELVLPDLEDGFGWVSAEFVTLSRPILGIPVSERASAAAPTAVPSAALASTPVAVSGISGSPTELSGRLVFQSTNGGTIYVYDLASGAISPLTSGVDPAISPDGKTVAFTRLGGDHGLYLIDISRRVKGATGKFSVSMPMAAASRH